MSIWPRFFKKIFLISALIVYLINSIFIQVAFAQDNAISSFPTPNISTTITPNQTIPINSQISKSITTDGKLHGRCLNEKNFLDLPKGIPLEKYNIPWVPEWIENAGIGLLNTFYEAGTLMVKVIVDIFVIDVPPCYDGSVPSDAGLPSNSPCFCVEKETFNIARLCVNIEKDPERVKCFQCSKGMGTWTGLGCVPNNFSAFLTNVVFNFGMGLAGMVALLGLIYSAITLQTSQGNAEKIEMARESITSFIVGLLLIIFSVFILRFLGQDVLQIVFGDL